jgi:decaprenylphospho-beta-D-ribofuranose 2-oxidase
MAAEEQLTGWGRRPVVPALVETSPDLEQATSGASASRGLGRAYGDAALPRRAGAVVACTRLGDRVLHFDAESGVLRAEAGLALSRLDAIVLPRGLACPVVPGTEQVTLGGMVAADVHGKNQHAAGCLGDHVRSLRIRTGDGRIVDVDSRTESELFRATIGAMGLTGHILEVELGLERIPSPWIWQEVDSIRGLDPLLERLREASRSWPFTVAWIDGLSRDPAGARGILFRGRWATRAEAKPYPPAPRGSIRIGLDAPNWLLGRTVVAAFNSVYAWANRRRPGTVSPWRFFFPLDAIADWNRLYGSRGFMQYQCVVPGDRPGAARRVLDGVARFGEPSFLAVIKDFGRAGPGLLSFAMPGTTLALDFPLGPRSQALVDALNEIVAAEGGRVYLAKDLLTRPEQFRAMEPRLDAFLAVRRKWDPQGRIATALSVRLFGDAA